MLLHGASFCDFDNFSLINMCNWTHHLLLYTWSCSWLLYEFWSHFSHPCLKFQSLLTHTSPLPFLITCWGWYVLPSQSFSRLYPPFSSYWQHSTSGPCYLNYCNPSLISLPLSLTSPISATTLIFLKYTLDFVISMLKTFQRSSQTLKKFLGISLLKWLQPIFPNI